MLRSPRDYQIKAIADLTKIYNTFPHDKRAFLKLPTGTGKTWTSFFFLREYYKNQKINIVWVAHQNNLVRQSHKALCEWLNIEYNSNKNKVMIDNISVEFMTWQGLAITKKKYDVLIIDEVHCGGSMSYNNSNDKRLHLSFKKIMKLAPTHLYISATPYNLDKELFPGLTYTTYDKNNKAIENVKSERQTIYSRKEAFKDNAIVNVKFIGVQTVDTIRLGELERNSSFDKIEEGVDFVKENDINIKNSDSKRNLRISMRESMLSVYFFNEVKSETIPQTIIFCKGRTGEDDILTANSINEEIRKFCIRYKRLTGFNLPTGSSLSRVVTSDNRNRDRDFEEFKEGKFPIICLVGMGKEGFDAPKTEVVIDLAHNTTNLRDLEQKIGRPIRINKGKDYARFYWGDTLENYIKVNDKFVKSNDESKALIRDILEVDRTDVTDEEVNAATRAVLHSAMVNNILTEEDSFISLDGQEILNSLESIENGVLDKINPEFKEKSKIIVTTSSLLVLDAKNTNPFRNIKTSYLFENTVLDENRKIHYNTIDKIWEAFQQLGV